MKQTKKNLCTLLFVLGALSFHAGAQKAVDTVFSKGQKITNDNFNGTAWLQQLVVNESTNSIQVGNVTFEPGARSNWHYHPAGQILLVTNGIGR